MLAEYGARPLEHGDLVCSRGSLLLIKTISLFCRLCFRMQACCEPNVGVTVRRISRILLLAISASMGATSSWLAEPTWRVPRLDASPVTECKTLMKATRAAR